MGDFITFMVVTFTVLLLKNTAFARDYTSELLLADCAGRIEASPAKRISRYETSPNPIQSTFTLIEDIGHGELKQTRWATTRIDVLEGLYLIYYAKELTEVDGRTLVLDEIFGFRHAWGLKVTELSGEVHCYEGAPVWIR